MAGGDGHWRGGAEAPLRAGPGTGELAVSGGRYQGAALRSQKASTGVRIAVQTE